MYGGSGECVEITERSLFVYKAKSFKIMTILAFVPQIGGKLLRFSAKWKEIRPKPVQGFPLQVIILEGVIEASVKVFVMMTPLRIWLSVEPSDVTSGFTMAAIAPTALGAFCFHLCRLLNCYGSARWGFGLDSGVALHGPLSASLGAAGTETGQLQHFAANYFRLASHCALRQGRPAGLGTFCRNL